MKPMNDNHTAMEYVENTAVPNVNTGQVILHVKDGVVRQIEENKKVPVDRLPTGTGDDAGK